MFYMTTYFCYYCWILDYTWDNLFWFYSFITIPMVVLNNVVQNICNILFILIEEEQLQTYFLLLHSVIVFLVCIAVDYSCSMLKFLYLTIFFLNFEDYFHQWRFRLDIRKKFPHGKGGHTLGQVAQGCGKNQHPWKCLNNTEVWHLGFSSEHGVNSCTWWS